MKKNLKILRCILICISLSAYLKKKKRGGRIIIKTLILLTKGYIVQNLLTQFFGGRTFRKVLRAFSLYYLPFEKDNLNKFKFIFSENALCHLLLKLDKWL